MQIGFKVRPKCERERDNKTQMELERASEKDEGEEEEGI